MCGLPILCVHPHRDSVQLCLILPMYLTAGWKDPFLVTLSPLLEKPDSPVQLWALPQSLSAGSGQACGPCAQPGSGEVPLPATHASGQRHWTAAHVPLPPLPLGHLCSEEAQDEGGRVQIGPGAQDCSTVSGRADLGGLGLPPTGAQADLGGLGLPPTGACSTAGWLCAWPGPLTHPSQAPAEVKLVACMR